MAGRPSSSIQRTAAPKPIASPIAGVPPSNLAGRSAQVISSLVTLRIIEPPPMKGGISSSSSRRPKSAPMPVGPYILWAVTA